MQQAPACHPARQAITRDEEKNGRSTQLMILVQLARARVRSAPLPCALRHNLHQALSSTGLRRVAVSRNTISLSNKPEQCILAVWFSVLPGSSSRRSPGLQTAVPQSVSSRGMDFYDPSGAVQSNDDAAATYAKCIVADCGHSVAQR